MEPEGRATEEEQTENGRKENGAIIEEKDTWTRQFSIPHVEVPCFCSKRWMLAYISSVSFIFVYAVRSDLSVAIVCMVKTNRSTSDLNITDPTCQPNANVSLGYERAEFDWGKGQQSGLLSAFYYGYIFANIPGGWLAGRFGGKYVLGIGWAIGAIATILTPVGARASVYVLYVIRVALGLATGCSYPAMQSMWGKWAPPMERSKLLSFTFSGAFIGNIITFTVSGYLCAEGFDNGWGSIFYVFGVADILWLLVWFIFVADSPSSHSTISDAERNYIVNSIGDTTNRVTSTPWKHIATSKALYACVICQFCFHWVIYLLVAELPTFLKEVLKFDVKSNGLLSSAPFIAMSITSLTGGQVADYLRNHFCSTKVTRRLFQTVSLVGTGACLIGTGYVNCSNRYVAVVLLCAALSFMGLSNAGYMVNIIEFAPRYAGVLFGISNMIATIPGMTAPLAVGALTPNNTQEEWRVVFYICAAAGVFGAIVFATLSEYDVKPWARDPVDTDPDMDRGGDTKKENGDFLSKGISMENNGYMDDKL